jgi:hypothetical protein
MARHDSVQGDVGPRFGLKTKDHPPSRAETCLNLPPGIVHETARDLDVRSVRRNGQPSRVMTKSPYSSNPVKLPSPAAFA